MFDTLGEVGSGLLSDVRRKKTILFVDNEPNVTFFSQVGFISLTLRFLKSQIILSDLKVTIWPPFVII